MQLVITPQENNVSITERITVIDLDMGVTVIPTADTIQVTPYGTFTASTLQSALEQLADQSFRSGAAPTTNLELGDVWYDTTNNIFFVYRTVNGTTDWYPLLNSDADNADGLDGGAF
jgi:hypothetical protein